MAATRRAGGKPHSAFSCRGTNRSIHGVFRPNRVFAAAPLRVWHTVRRATSLGGATLPGVAVVARETRCSKSLVGHAPRRGTPNATPLRTVRGPTSRSSLPASHVDKRDACFSKLNFAFMKNGKRFLGSAAFAILCVVATGLTGSASGADSFQVNVAGLKADDVVPARFVYNHAGCSGENISPEISWSGVPASAKSLAIVVWDQDAPVSGGFYHWVIVNLPVETKKLVEGAGNISPHKAPSGLIQLVNDWGEPGYGGPCPPGNSRHRYHFIVYALSAQQLQLTAWSKISEATAAIKKNTVASAEQVLVYGK